MRYLCIYSCSSVGSCCLLLILVKLQDGNAMQARSILCQLPWSSSKCTCQGINLLGKVSMCYSVCTYVETAVLRTSTWNSASWHPAHIVFLLQCEWLLPAVGRDPWSVGGTFLAYLPDSNFWQERFGPSRLLTGGCR